MPAKPKSPNYPGLDLGTAIDLAKQLYSSGIGRGEFTPVDAAQAWNYNSVSGPVKVRIGALRQYGLIEGKRGGQYAENPKLTRLALTLVMRPEGSREYRDSLREAALTPSLFSELYESHRNAADGALRVYLVIDKNFTDDGAQRCIEAYKGTLRLVGLDQDSEWSRIPEDEIIEEDEDLEIASNTLRQGTLDSVRSSVPEGSIAIPIPLDSERMATVIVPLGMEEADWVRLDRILEGYKPQQADDE